MHTSFKHTMDVRAWDLVGLHGYQDDPATCEICRIRDRVRATLRTESRTQVVDVVFDGPDARKAAHWVAAQMHEAQFDKRSPRIHRVLEVEHARLLARCAGAGWLEWIEEG